MLKACMTFILMVLTMLSVTTTNVEAKTKTKKKKNSTNSSYVLSSKKKKKYKNNRTAKSRRYKRSGTGPDLRALTTENPYAEYIQNPDNGVNALETKSELQ